MSDDDYNENLAKFRELLTKAGISSPDWLAGYEVARKQAAAVVTELQEMFEKYAEKDNADLTSECARLKARVAGLRKACIAVVEWDRLGTQADRQLATDECRLALLAIGDTP